MGLATIGLAFLAGLLSILSPCVLPLVPVVLGTAVSEHRFGPVVLAGGLALSFLVLGLFVATVGFAIGLDSDIFRNVAAILLLLFGVVLAVPLLQARLAFAAAPLGNWVGNVYTGKREGLAGQFAVGALLGAVWAPCAGPTLGAASMLAAQGRNLVQVSFVMLAYAIGSALPLLILGFASREALVRWRGRMLQTGAGGRLALGVILAVTGLLVLTGADKRVEATLLSVSPQWLTGLATAF
jgi:cytochrome c biogenesis protein CcdA